MNEIVSLTTADVSREIPVTSSIAVAETFKKTHKSVLKATRSLINDLTAGRQMEPIYFVQETEYTDKIGRIQLQFIMNEQFFTLLAMGFTGQKALEFKTLYIKEFTRLRSEHLARVETRAIGKASRLSITDAISSHVSPEGNFKKYAYGNYTKLVYKRVLGMDVKKAKESRGCPESGNLRDFLTIEELDKVQDLESKIAGFIEVSDTEGKNDKEIYQMVKQWIDGGAS